MMNSITRHKDPKLGFKFTQIQKPIPWKDYLIIRVYASPVNPSDAAFCYGHYPIDFP